jgi:hypothetical protein
MSANEAKAYEIVDLVAIETNPNSKIIKKKHLLNG